MIAQASGGGWEPSHWIAIVGIVGGVLTAFIGVWGATNAQREERRERERIRRRDDAADVLGPILTMLVDLDPDRVAINASDSMRTRLQALGAKWDELRGPLMTLAAGSTLPGVQEAASLLSTAMHNLLVFDQHLLRDILESADFDRTLQQARADYGIARERAAAMQAAING